MAIGIMLILAGAGLLLWTLRQWRTWRRAGPRPKSMTEFGSRASTHGAFGMVGILGLGLFWFGVVRLLTLMES
jgi:hypothetical protein